ncbi:FAD-dependent oxidoreductase [Halopseudomonas pelagia]|uniref:FAD-dependent oxidoreductase n=1 Tax=Halopseudomonas pelagia TaxID=553151 RepID=UPI0003A5A9E8|nr:FAD-dependent oxidoreductase [Halopseudomonas pelagia]
MNRPLVLAGAGHAHLVTLRNWIDRGFRPPAGTLLVNPTPAAWYSGMMPGLLAGRFSAADCAIDLAPLCRACDIELYMGKIQALDADARSLSLTDGTQLDYQRLSLNTGSIPPLPEVRDNSVALLPAKPFPKLHQTWTAWQQPTSTAPTCVAILGGGPAAFELALALRASLPATDVVLISASRLLASHPAALIARAQRLLRERGVRLIEQQKITRIYHGQLFNGDQPLLLCEAVVAATGASAPDWLRGSGLAVDTDGFARIGKSLISTSHPEVFATGDCASLPGALRSGVYAVRQGAFLADNILGQLQGTALRHYQPQRQALALLATADGGALMSYGRWVASGRLMGWWKDRLDIGFMQRHRISLDQTHGHRH